MKRIWGHEVELSLEKIKSKTGAATATVLALVALLVALNQLRDSTEELVGPLPDFKIIEQKKLDREQDQGLAMLDGRLGRIEASLDDLVDRMRYLERHH